MEENRMNELHTLHELVMKYTEEECGLPFAEGVVTAALCSPEVVAKERLYPAAIGYADEMPDFEEEGEEELYCSLLDELIAQVGAALEAGTFTPQLDMQKPAEEWGFAEALEWATGFREGLCLLNEDLLNGQVEVDRELAGFSLLSEPEQWKKDLKIGRGKLNELLQEFYEALPGNIGKVYSYFKGQKGVEN